MNKTQFNINSKKKGNGDIYLLARIENSANNILTINEIYRQYRIQVSVDNTADSAYIVILNTGNDVFAESSNSIPVLVKFEDSYYLALYYTRAFQGCITDIISMSDKNNIDGMQIISQINTVLKAEDCVIIPPIFRTTNWGQVYCSIVGEAQLFEGLKIKKQAFLNVEIKSIVCSNEKSRGEFLTHICNNNVSQDFIGSMHTNLDYPEIYEDSDYFYYKFPQSYNNYTYVRNDADVMLVQNINSSNRLNIQHNMIPHSLSLYPYQIEGFSEGEHVIRISTRSYLSGKIDLELFYPNKTTSEKKATIYISCTKNNFITKVISSEDWLKVINDNLYIYIVFSIEQSSNNFILKKNFLSDILIDNESYEDIKDKNHKIIYIETSSGSSDQRPINAIIGSIYYDSTLDIELVFDGSSWKPCSLVKGTTDNRPSLNKNDEGFEYYDTILKKKILWNGGSWVNIDGTPLLNSD